MRRRTATDRPESSYENRVYQVHAGRRQCRGGQVLPARALERGADCWKNTLCQAELMAAEVPAVIGPLCTATEPARCTTLGALPSASAPAGAGAGPSWTTTRCWSGLAVFWHASTPWAPPNLFQFTGPTGPAELWHRVARLAAGARQGGPWMCNQPGPRLSQNAIEMIARTNQCIDER
jgi:hypothetical protein